MDDIEVIIEKRANDNQLYRLGMRFTDKLVDLDEGVVAQQFVHALRNLYREVKEHNLKLRKYSERATLTLEPDDVQAIVDAHKRGTSFVKLSIKSSQVKEDMKEDMKGKFS